MRRHVLALTALPAQAIVLTAFLVAFVSPARAAEPVPGDACATAQQFKAVGGPETSGVTHMMVCQGGTWKAILSADATGQATKIGNLTCATNETIKFNGTTWACGAVAGTCDAAPQPFDFTDQDAVTTSTLYESNILLMAGTDPGCNSSVSISGSGTPQYRVCTSSDCSSVLQTWTGSTLSFDIQGKYLQVRMTSPSIASASHSATVTVGTIANIWSLNTSSAACGDIGPGDEGTICPDDSVFAGVSPDQNKLMFAARCDIGMTWDGSTCTGARSALPWNDGFNGNWVTTGLTNANTGESNTASLLGLDSDNVTGGTQPHQAADACSNLNVHGQTDWYLPARNELGVIYTKLVDGIPVNNSPDHLISGFNAGEYNSSSENVNYAAYKRNFGNGSEIWWVGKNVAIAVRCARTD